MLVRIGCAGWSIHSQHAANLPVDGSHLERYASCFAAVEINSSFYKSHRRTTYARWAATVPEGFSFAVKMPKEITHTRGLQNVADPLTQFFEEVGGLGDKLGAVLIQLPPHLSFDADIVGKFLETLRSQSNRDMFCEPRHRSWFTSTAVDLLVKYRVGRVAADPALVPEAARPGGWVKSVYYRLHGSPRMYYSPYSSEFLDVLSERFRKHSATDDVWCIFDNTAVGAAMDNALQLRRQCISKGLNVG